MRTYAFLISIALCSSLFGQTPDRERKWSVGASLSPVFHNTGGLGVELKRTVGSGAIRWYNTTRINTSSDTSFQSSTSSYNTAIGYEFRKTDNKWVVFYGGDLLLGFGKKLTEGTGIYRKEETVTAGGLLFLGFSYRLSNRLSLSSEIGKYFTSSSTMTYLRNGGLATDTVTSTADDFDTKQIIMINYHF